MAKEKVLKRKKVTVFDFYRNFVKDKKRHTDEIIQADFDPYSMFNLLSYDPLNLFIANELNRSMFTLPKRAIYEYFFNIIDKKQKVPFLAMKKDKIPNQKELIEIAQIYLPEMSVDKIKDVLPIIEDFLELKRDELTKGGKKR